MKKDLALQPLVSIVIPHIGKKKILLECLRSLKDASRHPFEVIVVDNGSDLTGPWELDSISVPLQYIRVDRNLGFAGGCNRGITVARGRYVALLNNDATATPGWLDPLIEWMEQNPQVAACQPKILSSRFSGKLDYAGAMGGLLDLFGYPFAIGRLFDETEEEGTYPEGVYAIFWASGTASLWRRSVLDEIGWLDESYFAHMEEIDLCWRAILAGYQIHAVTCSTVYHFSGYSLAHGSWRKMYLNHRNNLLMIFKNGPLLYLLCALPVRLLMEMLTAAISIWTLDFTRFLAVWAALFSVIWRLPFYLVKRWHVQRQRKISTLKFLRHLYRGSIVWQYFVRRRKRVAEFMTVEPVAV